MVHSERQSDRIVRHLMSYIENIQKTAGIRVLLVETSGTDDFVRSRSFYKQIGYTRETFIRDYYNTGDDKIIFR